MPAEPLAPLTPPLLLAPGETLNKLVPWLSIRWVMLEAAPRPIPMVIKTAATPIMIPSMVKIARNL
ncbi:MAG: hypothetical protein R3264_09920 [Anaerolineae bacterium]|nr:hypothetical protein [Anaerolineae bacterium]